MTTESKLTAMATAYAQNRMDMAALNKIIALRILAELLRLRQSKDLAETTFNYAYVGGSIDMLRNAELIDVATWGRLCQIKHNAYNHRCIEIGLKVAA